MTRVHFDRGIRTAMLGLLEPADGPAKSSTALETPASRLGRFSTSWPMRTIRNLLVQPPRYLLRIIRRYLLGPIDHKLNEINTKFNETNTKFNEINTKFNGINTKFNEINTKFNEINTKLDAIAAAVNAGALQHAKTLRAVRDLTNIVGSRFDEFEIKVRAPLLFDNQTYALRLGDGYLLAPRAEPMLVTMLADATSGGLEPGTRKCLKALLDPGMVVADIGANIGLHTLACARSVGPIGRVYAFEPDPEISDLLRKTLQLNGLRWVSLQQKAIGAHTDRAEFNVSAVSGHSSLYALPDDERLTARSIEVEVSRLDDAIPARTRVDVIKIDVEGAELDVLSGMTRIISESPDLAIIAEYGPSHLTRVGIEPRAWFGAFEAHGFLPLAIEEPSGICRPVSVDDLAEIEWINLAFIRTGGRAEARLLNRR